MKIGFDAKRAFNNGTGLGNYARFVINGLLKHFPQHQYFLFTPTIQPEFANFYNNHESVVLVTPESKLGQTFSSLWRTYAIADMCNHLELDVFHGLSNELPVGIQTFSGKKIVTIHDLIFLRYPHYYGNIDRYIYTQKFKYACQKADTIMATSHQTQQDIEHYFSIDSSKIAVGYQNCNALFGEPIADEKLKLVQQQYQLQQPFILCVGTIEQRKNQLSVLQAFHQAQLPNTHLVFIGKETSYAQLLHDYCTQNGLENKVQFLNQIPTNVLPAIYKLASLFVYASEFEGFGIPILEAMRSNIHTIAANTSSLVEVGGNYITYFEPKDILRLSELMNTKLQQPPLQADYYEKQLSLFDTSVLMQQLISQYKQ